MKRIAARQEGSMAIEASIVIPVAALCIVAVVYMGILLYQQVYLQTLANKVAERGAAFWDNRMKDVETGRVSKDNLNGSGLYWRLFDFHKPEKIKKIADYACKNLGAVNVLDDVDGDRSEKIKIELKDYIIYKKLTVTVKETYKIPVGSGLLKLLGVENGGIAVTAGSEAVLDEPAEFIRNIDFIMDSEKELEYSNPGIKKLGDGMRHIVSDVRNKIEKFFSR